MSLTRQLAQLIAAKPISQADREAAALFTLDLIANALAGRNSEPGRLILRWARAQGDDAGRRAFVIGALSHILETDDLHRASVVHPGCVVIPAALALGHDLGVQGHRFLASVLWGFEATCRVGMAVGPAHYRIWHNTATCGPFGSAMASAALLGLSVDQTVDALGNAGTQSAGLWQFLDTGAMSKHLHAGRGAEAGLVAAQLAKEGFTGPPAILEGEKGFFRATCPDADPAAVVRDPSAPWQLLVSSIKPWPSCRHTHPAIDAALDLRGLIDAEAIERVDVDTYAAAINVCDRVAPRSVYEAKFSLQHCVAAALSRNVDFDAFEGSARTSLAKLASKVKLTRSDIYDRAYPRAWGSAVSVTLRDGKVLRREREHAKGDPEAALSREEMIAKARMLLAHGKVREGDKLIDGVLALAADGPLPRLTLND
jgi:2-methylcitrate dehydratase PrpD